MALTYTRKRSLLASGFVLAPERYDPRRELSADVRSIPLGNVVETIKITVQPSHKIGSCLVLDTSDAREGIVICRKQRTAEIGSTKKAICAGDVIISRLRPYLRQIALVDDMIPNSTGTNLLCSTEFFVLRSLDQESIAFIVPFLLSKQVQAVLAVAQEGGHHPRFYTSTLLTLPMPTALLAKRNEISKAVEKAVSLYRESETTVDHFVTTAERSFLRDGIRSQAKVDESPKEAIAHPIRSIFDQ